MRTKRTLLSPESRGCYCRAYHSADDFDSQETGTQIFGTKVVNHPVNTVYTVIRDPVKPAVIVTEF